MIPWGSELCNNTQSWKEIKNEYNKGYICKPTINNIDGKINRKNEILSSVYFNYGDY